MKRFKLAAGAVLLAAAITIGYIVATGHSFAPQTASASDPASESPPASTPATGQAPTPSSSAGSGPAATPAGDSPSNSAAESPPAAANSDDAQALETLNSFYKPALKGQFPGAVSGLTIGVSTRQDVHDAIGEPPSPGEDSDAFDVYHAEMGNPGYAISYKLNRIRELRYFGTNVERQTNIGGITLQMLKKHWGEPSSTNTIKNGKLVQNKVVYNRGDYALSFIFNDDADLDHINLTAK